MGGKREVEGGGLLLVEGEGGRAGGLGVRSAVVVGGGLASLLEEAPDGEDGLLAVVSGGVGEEDRGAFGEVDDFVSCLLGVRW